jgi:hypothetical protein
MMNFVIVVSDAGEMKTVTSAELGAAVRQTLADESTKPLTLAEKLDLLLNFILDQRAITAGEYDPSDNDTPMVLVAGGPDDE